MNMYYNQPVTDVPSYSVNSCYCVDLHANFITYWDWFLSLAL